MRIKVEPFLIKKGNRVAKAAIEFTDGVLAGFHLVGFTICDDEKKGGLFVLFPASIVKKEEDTKPFFFLRPSEDGMLDKLQDAILDIYESMTMVNRPRLTTGKVPAAVQEPV